MARNGSGVYSAPAGTLATTLTTIKSPEYNAFVNDLVADANLARPITAGGTGSTSVATAQAALSVDNKVVYAVKVANYTAVAADNNAVLRFTAAATLTLTAAATLATNWHIKVIADGGDVTIDPNLAETIDGAATLIVPNGYSALIISDGAVFYTDKIISLFQGIAFGQCRLALSGGNLLLFRYNGNFLTINGAHYSIPSAGITLAASGLTPSTLYYIYAYMNSGTMTLEASATAYATDATTGMQIKTADATRTLVGMARPVTGPAWADTAKQRFVRSWFNDPGVSLFSNFTANRATTSLSYVELNSEIRCEFLNWSGEVVQATANGSVISGAANGANRSSLAFDGTTAEPGGSQATLANSDTVPFSAPAMKSGLAEGYHYVTLIGLVATGTGTWIADVDGRRTAITGRVSR